MQREEFLALLTAEQFEPGVANVPHSERFGSKGASYLVGRKSPADAAVVQGVA
jgi:hypothetical protein